jgi:hypothetical protein
MTSGRPEQTKDRKLHIVIPDTEPSGAVARRVAIGLIGLIASALLIGWLGVRAAAVPAGRLATSRRCFCDH